MVSLPALTITLAWKIGVISTVPAEVLNVCTGTGAADNADAAEIPDKINATLMYEPNCNRMPFNVSLLFSRLYGIQTNHCHLAEATCWAGKCPGGIHVPASQSRIRNQFDLRKLADCRQSFALDISRSAQPRAHLREVGIVIAGVSY